MALGVAVVGLGGISRGHISAWKKVRGVELRAVCDILPDRAAAAGAEHDVPWFTEVDPLLQQSDVHIVDLCLPPAAHAPVAMKALEAGRHVLVEKPIALTLEDAAAMRQAAARAGVQLGIISQLRFSSHVQQLAAWLKEGRLGRPLAAHVELKGYLPSDFYQANAKSYLSDPVASGGGMLMQVGIHHVDMLRFLLGDVLEVTWARVENLAHPGTAVEDYVLAHLALESGAHALVESASLWPRERRRQTRLIVATEKFTIEIERDRVLGSESPDGETLPWPEYVPGTHQLQMQDFVESISSGRPCGVTAGDGARSLALVRAIYEAGAAGKPVALQRVNAAFLEAS